MIYSVILVRCLGLSSGLVSSLVNNCNNFCLLELEVSTEVSFFKFLTIFVIIQDSYFLKNFRRYVNNSPIIAGKAMLKIHNKEGWKDLNRIRRT